jgi:4'-phosphopantetheinyl transferase
MSVYQPSVAFPKSITDREAVCLWWSDLDWPDADIAAANRILSADEQERASRYHRLTDRNHFVAGRALLRVILSRYIDADPDEIVFTCNAHGKLRLGNDWTAAQLEFNLAHSDGVGLYAFAIGHQVGVDLERIRRNVSHLEIARNFFAPAEIEALSGLTGDDQVAAFYRCWTRKEAYAKAIGLGFSLPLDSFIVPVRPETGPFVVGNRSHSTSACTLVDLSRDPSFSAAVAFSPVAKTPPPIMQFTWPNGFPLTVKR